MKETIHIYHTNDLHSHFEQWPKIKRYLHEKKKDHSVHNETVFMFDIGDHADRFHPLTEGTGGKGNIQLMNEIGYDAVTIGNNEGITFSYDELSSMYRAANFPVVVSNLFELHGDRPKWTVPHIILESKTGFRLAVIGVTAYYEHFYEKLGWRVTPPMEEVEIELQRLKGQYDGLVLLSHLGLADDEWIGSEYSQIDLILGGHTHHVLKQGKDVNGTLLGAAGKYGYFIGHMEIEISDDHKILSKRAELIHTQDLPEEEGDQVYVHHYLYAGREKLSRQVTTLTHPLKSNWFDTSPLGQILCQSIHEWTNADCTMINAGLLMGDLEEGMVTRYDLHQLLPHPINPCVIELKGNELKEVLKQSLNSDWTYYELKGLGFRGKVFGTMLFHHVEFGSSINQVYVKGKEIEPNKTYRLGTIDMFTFGHFFPELQRAKKHYYMPEFLRDVLEESLKY
ncbi:5'-nucleotidase [Bacillus coahuilensis m2-6]|uniref:bifunctional metallophosphatase/5'-nucleotidase n=1 Tax=Bacillus coahuilensis TaxID=408580 RepID=UPI0007503647|nr:bifunctional UDP-sugar hydrolase/5'-nucleotidase [Bacillus coahuilensis]KUP05784.1 5'-nucleotidase [Bacillus coahuilensis m2-6]